MPTIPIIITNTASNTDTSTGESKPLFKVNNSNNRIIIVIIIVLILIIVGTIAVFLLINANKSFNSNTSNSIFASTKNTNFASYTDPSGIISFSYPSNWIKTENTEGILVQIISPNVLGLSKPNFNIVQTDSTVDPASIESAMDSVVSSFKNTFTNFKLISKQTNDIKGAIKAEKIIYTWTSNETNIEQEQTLILTKSKYFQATFTASQENFDQTLDDRNLINSSISVK